MKKIPVSKLAAGQRFSRPVYIDDDSLFVPEGLEIKERDIERLARWNVEEVFTEGDLVTDDPQLSLNQFFLKAFSSPQQVEVTRAYGKLKNSMMSIYGSLRARGSVEQDEINEVVDGLLQLVERSAQDLVQYILYGMQGETGEIENALNVAVLSAMLGMRMQLARHKVLVLTTAALLHDVGMLRVNPEILAKQGKLTEDERRQVQTHPVHSYRMITKELGFSEDVGIAALQHQERWDGQGYPRNASGDAIRVEARIISVADSFVAMVSEKPYRSPMIGYTAMRTLLSDNGTRFDPAVLKSFIQVLGIYPIGSIVLLSDSSVCRVLENRSSAPLKPRVKVIIDADGNEFVDDNGPEIDLAEAKKLFIAKAVDANSLASRHHAS